MSKAPIQKSHEASMADLGRAEQSALVEKINSHAAKIHSIGQNIGRELIQIVVETHQMGFLFQTATGKDQLEFYLFQKLDGLDDKVHFGLAQRAVSIANRYKPNHKFTIAEAQAEVKTLFPELGITQKPERQLAAAPLEKSYGELIPLEFGKLNGFLDELVKKEPEATWAHDRWETIVAQTEYSAQFNAKGKKVLGI